MLRISEPARLGQSGCLEGATIALGCKQGTGFRRVMGFAQGLDHRWPCAHFVPAIRCRPESTRPCKPAGILDIFIFFNMSAGCYSQHIRCVSALRGEFCPVGRQDHKYSRPAAMVQQNLFEYEQKTENRKQKTENRKKKTCSRFRTELVCVTVVVPVVEDRCQPHKKST